MTERRTFGERLLTLALRCHPATFRQQYGDEVLEYYRETLAAESGRRGRIWRLRFLAVSVAAAAREGLRQRRSPRGRIRMASGAFGRAEALPSFGSMERPTMTGLTTDLRHAWRRLAARPLASILAAGMLALAIGVSTAMFTVVDALILRPVPFPDVERLASVRLRSTGTIMGNVSRPVFAAWRDSGLFTAVEGVHKATSVLDVAGGVVTADGAFMTPGMLPMLGARPIAGRLFAPEEGGAGNDEAVVIAERIWRTMFDADASIVGTPIRIDGRALVIVGVLPDAFRFPSFDTQFWRPYDYATQPERSTSDRPSVYARFASVEGIDAVLGRATTLAHTADPEVAKWRAVVWRMAGLNAGAWVNRATPFLAGGVALVFVVLCANVSSLLLAQMSGRAREFGMCAALGASRLRLVRQALTESLVLGAAGTLAGIAAAWALVTMTRAWLPDAFLMATLNPVDLDPRALAAASASGVIAIVAASLLPAWIGTRVDRAGTSTTGVGERGGTESRVARAFTRALLVGEVALTCALLVGTALLVGSFVRLSAVDRGLDTAGVLTAWVRMAAPAEAAPAAAEAIKRAVEAIPGVTTVSISRNTPPGGGTVHFGCCWLADTPGAQPLELVVDGYEVDNDVFDLYRIPLLRGRRFEPGEPRTNLIVSERLAAMLWPDGDAVGRSFKLDDDRYDVIGVARELRYPTLDTMRDVPEYFRPARPLGTSVHVNLRCAGACPTVATLRQTLTALPQVRDIHDAGLLDDTYTAELARPRAAATMAVLFTGIAVLAAAGGLFSVLSYAVGRRRREFGIRAALGARPAALQRLVFGEGMRLAIFGALVGGAAAWAMSRALASVVYEVSPAQPSVWLTVAAIIAVTTAAASWVPARRAARADPARLLRE